MFQKFGFAFIALCVLAACELDAPPPTDATLATELSAIVAPNQDLRFVELQEDNCYWYRYVGPVETTMLPLRARNGRPICVQVAEPATS